jgi:glucose/arabinose dehydrogenase
MPRGYLLLLVAVLAAGCESNNALPDSPPGSGSGDTITGRERIGWNQPAANVAELNTLRYAIYVDGARSVLAAASCTPPAGADGFPCSAQLPSMSPGAHVLELASFTDTDGIVESARSAPLQVTVAGATAPAASVPLVDGERVTTSDGVALAAELIADNFVDIVDLALAPDGRLVIAERSGRIHVAGPAVEGSLEGLRHAAPLEGPLLALTLAPDFARTGHVFMISTAPGAVRLSRHRLFDDQLIERMHVLPDIAASNDPSAVLRFGPDGKLYAAFDNGGSPDAAARLSDWRGKVLRLNPDGSTPDDQPAASPVFWSGIASPGGLDWSPEGLLWMAERGADGVERLRALVSSGARPRRAGQRASYVLPGTVGAASLAFYRGDGIREFRSDLFIAAREAGYLLRVRFDEQDRTRAVTTEKLLEGKIGSARAIQIAPDGSLYCASSTAVWRLASIDNPH